MTEDTKKIVEYFCSVMESRDFFGEDHCFHVRRITEILLEKLHMYCPEYELTKEKCETIACASALHDIGKIAISDRILCKPGRLTNDEFQIMKNHTRKGARIFSNIVSNMKEENNDYLFLNYCEEVCLYHHERYDGEGYPLGLKGEDIPISAQIVGLADAYDVLISDRIYKAAYPKEEAFDMIMNGDCGLFSPTLIEIFQMMRMEIEEITK